MKKLNLPIINSERTTSYHDFYSVCIKAIKSNKENILNKSECIHNIEKLKYKLYNKKKNFLLNNHFFDKGIKRKILTERERKSQILYKKRTLGNIILDCKKLESKSSVFIPPLYLNNSQVNTIENNNNLNSIDIPNIIKIPKKISISKKEEIKSNIKTINKKEEKSPQQIDLKKQNPITNQQSIIRKVIEYLESNDITLFECIKHDPFQKKPYQISKSFEFLNAVKFKNYEYIHEALNFSKSYLFCFDYFGQTCYHWAAKLSNIKMLQILIEYGKHINQRDFRGRTPLYLAAFNNDKTVCEILIKNKANPKLPDYYGYYPSDVTTNRELKYYLGDFMTQEYKNPSCKIRVTVFFKKIFKKFLEKLKEKKEKEKEKAEEEERIKKQKEEEEEEENDDEEE